MLNKGEIYEALICDYTTGGDGIAKVDGCVVFVNGESANKRRKLTDGDTVTLMPPVAGG